MIVHHQLVMPNPPVVDKTGLPWIDPIISDLRRSPGDTCQNTHGKRHILG